MGAVVGAVMNIRDPGCGNEETESGRSGTLANKIKPSLSQKKLNI